MGEKRRSLEYYNGNAVRDFPMENPKPRQLVKKRTKSKKRKSPAFSGRYTAILAVALIAICSMCVYYIQAQSELTKQRKQIEKLEQEVNLLNDENNVTKERLQSQVDLDQIYEIATQKLGMVYAKDKQIIYYSGQSKDYVRQYSEIPAK